MWTQGWHQFAHFVNNLTLYDITSGWGPFIVVTIGVITAIRHWNCNERFCPRHGYPHPDHGRPVCNHHYHSHKPDIRGHVDHGDRLGAGNRVNR